MFQFKTAIAEDRSSVTLKFPPEETRASTAEMEELALAFAAIRSNMNPPVANDPALGVMATPNCNDLEFSRRCVAIDNSLRESSQRLLERPWLRATEDRLVPHVR